MRRLVAVAAQVGQQLGHRLGPRVVVSPAVQQQHRSHQGRALEGPHVGLGQGLAEVQQEAEQPASRLCGREAEGGALGCLHLQ